MYDNSEIDKQRTLQNMMSLALQRCRYNHIEARELVAGWISQDRRYDGRDARQLAQEADEYRQGRPRPNLSGNSISTTGRRLGNQP